MISASASSSPAKSRRRSGSITSPTFFSSSSSSSSSTFTLICNHHSLSSLITLDHLLLLLTLLSCSFLVISSFSHILYSIYLFLPPLLPIILSPVPILIAVFLLILAIFFISLEFTCPRRTKCGRPKCKGLRDAVEFDVKVQTEEGVRAGIVDEVWREIGELPWKGGGQGDNPDYECVRKELRRMAPPNGRAVLLFRARCGCPLAKLEGWGTKRGKRHKNGAVSKSGFIS